MRYFTSDLHFGHRNIIDYAKRPFSSTHEMDEHYIRMWNNKVRSNKDIVYVLGDFSMLGREKTREILKRLNGRKILIIGNHDDQTPRKHFEDGWYDVYQYKYIELGGYKVLLTHKPPEEWSFIRKVYNIFSKITKDIVLCGHVHTMFFIRDNVINVGIDNCESLFSEHDILNIVEEYLYGLDN